MQRLPIYDLGHFLFGIFSPNLVADYLEAERDLLTAEQGSNMYKQVISEWLELVKAS